MVILVILGGAIYWRSTHAVTSVSHVIGATLVDPSGLPGLLSTPAPWSANVDTLRARLGAISMPALNAEGAALHIHQHLDIFIEGTSIEVPANIGVGATFISPVHVHDPGGIVHVESPVVALFTLGHLFDVWGVRFTQECIGEYCSDATRKLKVFFNGTEYTGDKRMFELKQYQQIVITYGTDAQIPKPLPSKYDFPAGY